MPSYSRSIRNEVADETRGAGEAQPASKRNRSGFWPILCEVAVREEFQVISPENI
jgi:hypothetical protein